MSKTTYGQMTTTQVDKMLSFLEQGLLERFMIRPKQGQEGHTLLVDPISIIGVIVEVGTYLNEQYEKYNAKQWQDDVTARLIRIEQQLNALTNLVNDLFGFTQAVVELQSIYEQNAYLASHRSFLENVMLNAQKHDKHGWPIATGAQVNIVETAREVATSAVGVFMKKEIYGFTPFISVYSAAMVELTAMLVTPETKRSDVASRLDVYIQYFELALADADNALPRISSGLKVLMDRSAQPMDVYPKYGSIGISKPGILDPEYDPNAATPTNPRIAWSLFQVAGSKEDGFSAGPLSHTFEWQTPDKILPCQPPMSITFGRETFDSERMAMVVNYLNGQRPPYLSAKQKFDGAELQVALAQTLRTQLKKFQNTLRK